MSERLSDMMVANLATRIAAAKATTSEVEALAREVQERRKDDWAIALADLKLSADMLAVRDLCDRHGITVEGIVALVDALYDYQGPTVPGYGWLRRLARGEEA